MSTPLERCMLIPIDGSEQGQPTGAPPVEAQFNPTSLRLSMTNEVGSGGGPARQAEQYVGASSTSLAFDLVFDTADEGTTEAPVSVRTRSYPVMQFLLPTAETKDAPPRVRFHWGTFVYDGVVTSLNEDLDLFASNGVPLRSKLAVSIKEQRPEFAALQQGAGGRTGPAAAPNRTAPAIGGESLADFAVRMNLDPAAWRGLAAGIGSTLSLEAGLEIDFSTSLTAGVGIGLGAGVEAGAGLSLEASVGLDASVDLRASTGTPPGMALSAAGGVRAATDTVAAARAEAAAAEARAAFGAPAPSRASATSSRAPAAPPRPSATSSPSARAPARPAPRPAPPIVDGRATSYGAGVPLRPRAEGAAEERRSGTDGWVKVDPRRAPEPSPPLVRDLAAPPWSALPQLAPGREAAAAVQRHRRPLRPCGCAGDCRHGGGSR